MSHHHSPESSSGHGPSSSPYGGTDPTQYSPDMNRKEHRRQVTTISLSQRAAETAAVQAPPAPVTVPVPAFTQAALNAQAVLNAQAALAVQAPPAPITVAVPAYTQAALNVQAPAAVHVPAPLQFQAPNLWSTLPQPPPYVEGCFINEMIADDPSFMSRYQFVTQLPDGTNAGLDPEHELFQVQKHMKHYQAFNLCVPYYARGVYLRYDDLRDAAEAKAILEQHEFCVAYATSYDYAVGKSQDTAHIKEFEGQIVLSVNIMPHHSISLFHLNAGDMDLVTKAISATADAIGDVRTIVHIDSMDDQMLLVYRIEFHSVDAAIRAVQSLTVAPASGHAPNHSFSWCTFRPASWVGERAMASPHRHKPRIDALGRYFEYRPAAVHLQLPDRWSDRRSAQSSHPHDQHNRVRRQRIMDGGDVRTTVMLRNIPNKLDWMALKNILDEVCFGTYDFMYLRIDFKSGCNVGYAFINFTDSNGMLSMIDRMERRSWPGFTSDKTAEISYATIQGREALVQKFRNSSVMQETPFCRPRLIVTLADAEAAGRPREAGVLQKFPSPDNLSKLQRSMDSARSVGLYPPHGWSGVVEHRNRASAFDRGGPRDMMQAAMHFAHQRAQPMPFRELTESKKQDVEMWYLHTFGGGHCGRIPFECIPMTHVNQYLSENVVAPPGIITRPARAGPPTASRRTPFSL